MTLEMDVNASRVHQNIDSNGADLQTQIKQDDVYFIAKVRLLLSYIVESPSVAFPPEKS